jgi:hypothetical protein
MSSSEKKQTKEAKPASTFKKVIQKEILKEKSVTLCVEVPKVRYLKLNPFYRQRRYSCDPCKIVPELRLCGNWLEAAGFLPEEYVSVTVMNGLLIIRSSAGVEQEE